MNKKGFIDLDDISPGMLILTLVGFVVGLIGAKQMGAGLLFRLFVAVVCGAAGYFISAFVASR